MRVLLAEDDVPLAEELVYILRGNRFAVDKTFNGEDALHIAQTGHYDSALLDIGLPLVDG